MKRILKIALLLLAAAPALGAFRVYKLRVRQSEPGYAKKTQLVLSHLDHLQYAAYYGLHAHTEVSLVDTWYCPGDTSRRDYCPKPAVKPYRGLAGIDEPKRIPFNRLPIIP